MVSKKIISDQILFRISGGYQDNSSPVDERDIWKATEQIINTAYKLQQFAVNLPSGETIPENLMLGVYEGVAVTSTTTNKSKATLPIMPISLPKGMGIYLVYQDGMPDNLFIPLQRGFTALLKTDYLLNDVLGQVTYESQGRSLIFNKDLPLYDINSITMELVVMDLSLYGTNDPLPIPADMESGIIEQLFKMFSNVVPEDAEVNPYTTVNQQTITNPKAVK